HAFFKPGNGIECPTNSRDNRPNPQASRNAIHGGKRPVSCRKRSDASNQCTADNNAKSNKITLDKSDKKAFFHHNELLNRCYSHSMIAMDKICLTRMHRL